MVEVGVEASERIEITSDFKEGDVIVITSAYLINSEYILRRARTRWQE